ncbi:hypothetical protein GCM10010435_34860 [Winogradskya consettensis]|uniref:Uncharacterized protein n=1 Tax=Winogradskya consettensis TaxID=113560 RepID=A0A919VZ90_9ACTN|nr:hypothetical protein [Actinoplanes consettensis]GIM74413.1 hypothetical protein Aco04nite_40180 [Actinoplanes consettensis]
MTTAHRAPGGFPAAGATPVFNNTAEADHWLTTLQPLPLQAFTTLVRTPRPHVAVTETPSEGARAVIFPGSSTLTGDLSAADILSLSAINAIEILGGAAIIGDQLIRTGDFIRPQWQNGGLILTVMPAVGGLLVPFETRNPTPCCADHA